MIFLIGMMGAGKSTIGQLLSKKTGLKTIKEIEVQNKNHKLDDLKSSESFKEAINLFPDLEIINVKDLEEDSND